MYFCTPGICSPYSSQFIQPSTTALYLQQWYWYWYWYCAIELWLEITDYFAPRTLARISSPARSVRPCSRARKYTARTTPKWLLTIFNESVDNYSSQEICVIIIKKLARIVILLNIVIISPKQKLVRAQLHCFLSRFFLKRLRKCKIQFSIRFMTPCLDCGNHVSFTVTIAFIKEISTSTLKSK